MERENSFWESSAQLLEHSAAIKLEGFGRALKVPDFVIACAEDLGAICGGLLSLGGSERRRNLRLSEGFGPLFVVPIRKL
jgi:hypothetical protein